MSAQQLKGSQIPNAPSDVRNATVYVSDPFVLPQYQGNASTITAQTVTLAATGKTYVIQSINGNIDFNRVLAERNYDGSYAPGPQAKIISPTGALDQTISNPNSQFAINSRNQALATIKKLSPGSNPDEVLNKGIQGGRFDDGSVARSSGAPPPRGQSGGEADVAGNRSVVTSAVTELSSLALSINGQSAIPREDVKELSYPLKMPDGMDYIKFASKEYGTKNINSSTLAPGKRNIGKELESVLLPIQSSISDANTVGWNEETFNPAQIIGANLAIAGIQNGAPGLIGQLQETLSKLKGNKSDVEKAIIAYFTEQAIGVQVLPKISGAVFNPNTELLFQGPQLRAFNFQFKLTPRSSEEAKRVKTIIAFFKRNMAAQTVKGGLYLKAPKVFGITYYHRDKPNHPGIGLIKECALQACNVDYTPDGSYMAFDDGSMVSYSLNLQFMELEPIYSTDYDDETATKHGMGY